jgi:hypothetical protein
MVDSQVSCRWTTPEGAGTLSDGTLGRRTPGGNRLAEKFCHYPLESRYASDMAVNQEMSTVPYVAWRTFWTFIEELRAAGSAPQVIDGSVLGENRSGAARSQLLITLRFLGLTDHSKQKTNTLDELVAADEPMSLVRSLLEHAYAPVFSLGLESATVGQVNETLTSMGSGQGETLRKARMFFLNAATDAGVELGPHLRMTKTTRPGNGQRKPRRATAQPRPPRSPDATEAMKQTYFDVLIEKAKDSDSLDEHLLDRIEKLIGMQPDQPTD